MDAKEKIRNFERESLKEEIESSAKYADKDAFNLGPSYKVYTHSNFYKYSILGLKV